MSVPRLRRGVPVLGAQLAFAVAMFPATPPASETQPLLYVAPTGSDANPGTRLAPFRTIRRASLAATPGTTVHVAPGDYHGGFQTDASGTAMARIYYRSDRKWGARLFPSAQSSSEMAWDNRGNYVTIDGFQIDGAVSRGGTPWAGGIYLAGSHDIVENSLVHDVARTLACSSHGGAGISTDHYYQGVADDVLGNIVHDIGPPGCRYVQGIYISTSGKVENNLVYHASWAGIHLWHDATHVSVINNTVAHNQIGIFVGGGDQYHLEDPDDYTVVTNNISVDNAIDGFAEHGTTGTHNIYAHNLVARNGRHDFNLQNGLMATATIVGDPLFQQDGTDFHLRAGSPAIDRGTSNGAPVTDLDGTARPAGAGYDIGAYEYVVEAR